MKRYRTITASASKAGVQIGTSAPPIVHQVLRSAGQPLDGSARAVLEPRFSHSFANVRVHTDARAADSARAVGAQAYTVGKDVVFGAGQYKPSNPTGLKLIAHELTHVQQQRNVTEDRAAEAPIAVPDSPFEREAEAAAAGAVSGMKTVSEGGPQLQRMPWPPTELEQAGLKPPERPVRRQGGTVPYREATELADCVRILGEDNAPYCRHQVLGDPMPKPTHHHLPGITTPLPTDVELNPDKTASFKVNKINVVFDPDTPSSDPKLANRAETSFHLHPWNINHNSANGLITQFTGPGPVEIHIQTTYGPGASMNVTSGYGRGTTPEDVKGRRTSLGFHEGHHGQDFIDFLQAHPYPRFIGKVGMTTKQFISATDAYKAAVKQFGADMDDYSKQKTDCVGKTIDTANAANGIQTKICHQLTPTKP